MNLSESSKRFLPFGNITPVTKLSPWVVISRASHCLVAHELMNHFCYLPSPHWRCISSIKRPTTTTTPSDWLTQQAARSRRATHEGVARSRLVGSQPPSFMASAARKYRQKSILRFTGAYSRLSRTQPGIYTRWRSIAIVLSFATNREHTAT